ncbi:BTAD domain-containing putative transcriptional regulator, partial [Actinosynnema sp. NPDC059335]|uniref:BTAD domain-containing putative transcriptional regulator n=1 Tax=Actinosynnema sp. NPDC059335 TaxID=3346804 RepID=UPI00366DA2C0
MSTSSGDGVRVSVLGPVRAWLGGEERPLGPARQRAVLGLLTARANRLVSRDELVDGLWGDAPPASAVGSLHTYVSGLRRALGPARDVLVSQTSGYSLRLAVGAVDAEVFARARSDARLRLDAGDHRAARAALEDALGLWHGEAYSGVPGPFAEVERRRLEELRLSAVELKARAALELGAHREVVAELGGLVGEHPQRESLWEVLMVALDRSGRQAEALEAFREARRALVDGQGVEPGRVLRDLHQRIVTGTPEHRRLLTVPPHVAEAARTPGTARDAGAGGMAGLAGEVGAVDVAGAARETGAASVGVPDGEAERVCEAGAAGGGGGADGFVGRRDEIALLRGLVADVAAGRGAAVWVEGEAGIGKSALLTAALADAARRGCQVGWAVADESGRRFPLQAVHDCLDLRPDGRPCHVPGHRNPTRHAPARHDPAHQDRTRQDPLPAAVDRLLGLVDRICADGPLLLVLDDLHRADDAGLLMWYRLLDATRRLPLLLVAASRPDPARRELTGLRRGVEARHGHVLALGPLAARDTEELVGRVVGGRPGEVLREVARRTAGHPLYAHEVAHALVRD